MNSARTLVRLMKKQAVKGTELAQRLRVKPSFISQVRSGKRSVPPDALGRWIKALRLSEADALLFRLNTLRVDSPEQLKQAIDDLQTVFTKSGRKK
jgi:transcriptional regulator with XRE-family HTH domain